jgi:hypothetical protein
METPIMIYALNKPPEYVCPLRSAIFDAKPFFQVDDTISQLVNSELGACLRV